MKMLIRDLTLETLYYVEIVEEDLSWSKTVTSKFHSLHKTIEKCLEYVSG